MAEEEKKTNWMKFILNLVVLIVVLIIILAIIFVVFNWNIAGVSVRERMHNIYDKTIVHWFSYTKTNVAFMSPFFKGTDILLGGKEDIFSLEEKGQVKEKTGVEISELTTFGLDSKGDFGGDANIIVYKFDKSIKEMKVFVSCELKAEEYNDVPEYGTIKSVRVKDLDGGRGFVIKNYEKRDKEEIPVRCIFPMNKKPIKGSLIFKVIYSFPNKAKLDTFVVQPDIFSQYEDRPDLAFKELADGVYSDYKSMITSTRDYDADVKLVMFFDRQPLTIGSGNVLSFRFKNDNSENKINFESFYIDVPQGLRLNCPYTDFNNQLFLKDLDEQLNNEDRTSDKFECLIDVTQDVFGNSRGEMLKLSPPIIGKFYYNNILKKEVALEFK